MTQVVVSPVRQSGGPASGVDLVVTPAAGPGSTAVAVTGGSCTPQGPVSISFRGEVLNIVRSGEPGEFSATIIIPNNSRTGAGAITAVGQGCHLAGSFTVKAGAAHASAASKINSASGIVEILASLGIFGAVLVFAVRRNRGLASDHRRQAGN